MKPDVKSKAATQYKLTSERRVTVTHCSREAEKSQLEPQINRGGSSSICHTHRVWTDQSHTPLVLHTDLIRTLMNSLVHLSRHHVSHSSSWAKPSELSAASRPQTNRVRVGGTRTNSHCVQLPTFSKGRKIWERVCGVAHFVALQDTAAHAHTHTRN